MAALDKTILAIDTSGMACSVALWRRGAVVAHRYRAMARGHAEALMPMVVEAVAGADATLRALDAVAVTVGPGAFTGIRIGLAAARGIGLAAAIPVIGVTTFAAVAEAIPDAARAGRSIVVVLDTKRGDLYVQSFADTLTPSGPPAILQPEDVVGLLFHGVTVVAGDGVALLRPYLRGNPGDPEVRADGPIDATRVAKLAARMIVARLGVPPVPLYLRAPDVRLAPSVVSIEGAGGSARPA